MKLKVSVLIVCALLLIAPLVVPAWSLFILTKSLFMFIAVLGGNNKAGGFFPVQFSCLPDPLLGDDTEVNIPGGIFISGKGLPDSGDLKVFRGIKSFAEKGG